MTHLFIRTEASNAIGMGHFMRCFAIAELARTRGIEVTFLLNEITPQVDDRITSIGAHLSRLGTKIASQDDAQCLKIMLPNKALLIVDTYLAEGDYLDALYAHFRLIFMDDLAKIRPLRAHLVINAASNALDLGYDQIAPQAKALLGPQFAQIRLEFRHESLPQGNKPFIAIMMGGSDAKSYSQAIAEIILASIQDVDIRVVLGPAVADFSTLETLATHNARLSLHKNPANLAQTLAGACLVVTAGGGSVLELSAMGLMAIVLVIADNQENGLTSCDYPCFDARNGLPENLNQIITGYYQNPIKSSVIANNAKTLIDGRGCERIVEAISNLGSTSMKSYWK